MQQMNGGLFNHSVRLSSSGVAFRWRINKDESGRADHGTRVAERGTDRAVLSGKDPGCLGRGGFADGRTGLGRGSVGRGPARWARANGARPSRAPDGRPDLAVRTGDALGSPRAGLAALAGPA